MSPRQRRPLLDGIWNPHGGNAAVRDLERRIQRVERAPVKFSLERVKEPKKAPQPGAPIPGAGSPRFLFTPLISGNADSGQLYGVTAASWATHAGAAATDGNQFLAWRGLQGFYSNGSGDLNRTLDGGITWDIVPIPAAAGFVTGLAIGLNSDFSYRLWLISHDAGIPTIWWSDNAGDSWTLSWASDDADNNHIIVAHPTNSGVVVAFFQDVSDSNKEKAAWSDNNGDTWNIAVITTTRLHDNGGSFHAGWMNGTRLLLGAKAELATNGHYFWSDDVGATWTLTETTTGSYPRMATFGDSAAFFADPTINGTDASIIRRTTDGENYTDETMGSDIYTQGLAYNNGLYVLSEGGTFNRISSPGSSWTPVALTDGPDFGIGSNGNHLGALTR